MNILLINAGSSSLKYQLFDMTDESVLAKGICERIGMEGSILKHSPTNGESVKYSEPMPNHRAAIELVFKALTVEECGVINNMDEIDAVGHRVLHGADKFSESVLINSDVEKVIEEAIPLGPLHNPANLMGIRACKEIMPNTPQVAVFDTAFHQSIPEKAFLYALPYEYYEKYKIRRYGFHGSSHRFVSARAAELLSRTGDPEFKVITCHLGNGSSFAAVKGGVCIDTSMGLTPLEGIPMGTRSGSVDPAVLEFIMSHERIDIAEMTEILNKKSGVLGVSGISSDFRDLENAYEDGNIMATLALDIFNYSGTKMIGAYAAAMGGLDAIVFTAGIGENDPFVREQMCSTLGFLGVKIDPEKNTVRGKETDLSAPGATVRTLLIPTNEELVIARDTKDIVTKLTLAESAR
ncbi:MAG: acetate kinase [Clostridiales bacterium]|nr:acetate kinase [Clostridiales bacterium]